MQVAICIPSYKRPTELERCLRSITNLKVPDDVDTIVIVADNDVAGSAATALKDLPGDMRIDYRVVPEQGICNARNSLLTTAIEHQTDLIAFIDDDEEAHPDWLKFHMETIQTYQVEISRGPVIPLLEGVERLDLSKRLSRMPTTGTQPRRVETNNVCFASKLVHGQGLRFDPFFNLIGGEDHDFFIRAVNKGARAAWCADAIVFEWQPKERQTKKYLAYRHFTGGINAVLRYKRYHGYSIAFSHFLLKTIGKILGGVVDLIIGIVSGRKKQLNNCIKKFSVSAGYVSALLGYRKARYKDG